MRGHGQCLERYLDTIGQNPSVSKSNQLHVVIFCGFFINLRFNIPQIHRECWVIVSETLMNFNQLCFSNSTGLSVINQRLVYWVWQSVHTSISSIYLDKQFGHRLKSFSWQTGSQGSRVWFGNGSLFSFLRAKFHCQRSGDKSQV